MASVVGSSYVSQGVKEPYWYFLKIYNKGLLLERAGFLFKGKMKQVQNTNWWWWHNNFLQQ